MKLKPRKGYKYEKNATQRKEVEERNYIAYQKYIALNNHSIIVQMDTVEGIKKAGKTLLTLHFPDLHLMLIFLLEAKTASNVTAVFNYLEDLL